VELTPEHSVPYRGTETFVVALDEDVPPELETGAEGDAHSRGTLFYCVDRRGEDGLHGLIDLDEGSTASFSVVVRDAMDYHLSKVQRLTVDFDSTGEKACEIVDVPSLRRLRDAT